MYLLIQGHEYKKNMRFLDQSFRLKKGLLALCEVALKNGIHTMISNYEPHMRWIHKLAGAEFDELGRADGYGRFQVCCGAFEVSRRVLTQMRSKLGISEPLYARAPYHKQELSNRHSQAA
jgi:acyl homoserine lactone synthase